MKERGAAVLVLTVVLMLFASLTILFMVQFGKTQQSIASNQTRDNQAFFAAEAGLEYAYAYLQTNSSTVISSAVSGVINYALSSTTLSNGATYTVKYTNPTLSNFQILEITSVGASADNTATKTINQLVYQQPNTFKSTVAALGNVTFVGGSTLTNTITNVNITTGQTVTINNGAQTYTSSGSSSSQGNIKSDVQQNFAAYQGMSEANFFQTIFGSSQATVKSAAQAAGNYYSNSGPDYSQTLSGIQGQVIYISQTNGSTVTLGHGVTIGSPTSPVTLIVEGDLNIANGVTLYGFVYSTAPNNGFYLAGGAKIIGGIASAGIMNISNGFQLTYTAYPVLAGGSGSYAKITGGWLDF